MLVLASLLVLLLYTSLWVFDARCSHAVERVCDRPTMCLSSGCIVAKRCRRLHHIEVGTYPEEEEEEEGSRFLLITNMKSHTDFQIMRIIDLG